VRIRSILPEFYRSEDVAAMDWHTRLVFIGLWSYVDDNGVGRDNVRLIASDLFPLDGDSTETLRRVSTALGWLSEHGQIERYKVDGVAYFFVVQWDRYQRVQNPGKARYPRPTSDNVEPPDALPTLSGDSPETLSPGEGEKGRRGEGKDPSSAAASEDEPDPFDEFWSNYPRKVEKADARKAWQKAIKKTTASEIIDALKEYPFGDDPKFIKHAATWLNKECWNDTPDNVRQIRGQRRQQVRVGERWRDAYDDEVLEGRETRWVQ
jgi:hypothetical protein